MTEILVTAGPTREHLDDVRFLSNGSTGRMGYAIAAAAVARACSVTLVSGPTALSTPAGVRRVDVVSADEMLAAAQAAFARCDVAFFAAAVADHRPARRHPGKPPKATSGLHVELVPNPDIAGTLGEQKGSRVCVGFALESFVGVPSADVVARVVAKARRKHFDLCVVNAPDALAREGSRVFLFDPLAADDGPRDLEELPHQDKAVTAALLVERALTRRTRVTRSPSEGRS